MAWDGGEPERDDEPDTVRRQVVMLLHTVIDVPADLDENETQKYIDETCKADMLAALVDAHDHDDESEACHICALAKAVLVPQKDEVKNEWLENLGYD